MKTFLTLATCTIALATLTACSSPRLDRSHEESLNRVTGVEVTQTERGTQVRLPIEVLFNFNESNLRAGAGPAIDRTVILLKRSEKPIVVEGYTDNIGTREYNQFLSEARAKTVAAALESRGINASRITLKGFAYDRPIADNNAPEGRAGNRRTEIEILGESIEIIMGR